MPDPEESSLEDDEPMYDVERILAQYTQEDGQTVYLVKWLGYPDYQCTWEPPDSFASSQTLEDWQRQYALGDTLDADETAAVQARMEEYAQREEEKQKQKAKKTRLAQRQTPSRASSRPSPTSQHDTAKREPSLPESSTPKPKRPKPEEHTTSKRPPDTKKNGVDVSRSAKPPLEKTNVLSSTGPTNVLGLPSTQSKQLSRKVQGRPGERFKNLRHQNNYAKLSRREPAPDISKLDTRAADEWPESRDIPAVQAPTPKDDDGGSPLFVPIEDEEAEGVEESIVAEKPAPVEKTLHANIAPQTPVKQLPARSAAPQSDSIPLVIPASKSPKASEKDTSKSKRSTVSASSKPSSAPQDSSSLSQSQIVVNLSFGEHVVGNVKIQQLPLQLVSKIPALNIQSEQPPNLDFHQRYVVDSKQFSTIFPHLDTNPPALGTVAPDGGDARVTLTNLAEQLEFHDRGGIWEHPQSTCDFVVVLYPRRARGWSQLAHKKLLGSATRLQIMVLKKTHDFHLEKALSKARDLPSVKMPLAVSASKQKRSGAQSDPDASNTGKDPGTRVTSKVPKKQLSHLPDKLADPNPVDSTARLKISFPAQFEDLLKMKPQVYIAFTTSYASEATALVDWLSQYISPQHIYTNGVMVSWNTWRRDIMTKPGILLFHEQDPAYCDLEQLATSLSSEVICYNLSFKHDEKAKSAVGSVSKLFPKGIALFVTENALIDYPDEVLSAMEWIEQQSQTKVQNCRLGLVPKAKDWLTIRAARVDEDLQEKYLSMLRIVYDLEYQAIRNRIQGSIMYHPDQTASVDLMEDYNVVLSPTNLPGYVSSIEAVASYMDSSRIDARDRILSEYFCAWAGLNANKYRRFILLDEHLTNKTQKHSWHVQFETPAEFVQGLSA